jgi:hypothetical protein
MQRFISTGSPIFKGFYTNPILRIDDNSIVELSQVMDWERGELSIILVHKR